MPVGQDGPDALVLATADRWPAAPRTADVPAGPNLDPSPDLVRATPLDWWFEADFLREIGSADRLLALMAEQRAATIVKTGPHRTVVRLDLPTGEYYVKHFRVAGWRPVFQNLVRPCKAVLEGEALRRVAALGLPTVQPVGLARERRGGLVGESYLVTRSIAGAVPLDQFVASELSAHPPWRREELRRRLAAALGDLIGQMHARGAVHPDLHPGNVLVRLTAGEVQLWLIDLHAIQLRQPVSPSESAVSLAALNQFFGPRTSRAERHRFYRGYCAARGWSGARGRSLLPNFLDQCDRATHRLWERADRAWRRGNRHQSRLDAPHANCRGLAILDAPWLAKVRDAPETLFEQGLQWWCKRSGRRRVAAVTVPGPGGTTRAFLKAIESSGSGRWLGRLRRSAVRRAWETGHAFLRRGIATPRPLLYVEAHGSHSDRSYLLTEAVPDSLTLADFCRTVWPQLTRARQREWIDGLSRTLARQLQWMHVCRFDHRDLKFENILVPADPGRHESWLLDLDAVRRWPLFPQGRCVQNLARLNVSTLHLPRMNLTDRLRFLRRYLGPGEGRNWKTWWRQIARKSRQKEQQNKRRGRPLS